MSKRLSILAVLVLALTVTACKTPKEAAEDTQNTQEPDTTAVVQTDEDPASEVVDEEITSYFTGLPCTKEQQQHRPIAVMLNNIKEGSTWAPCSRDTNWKHQYPQLERATG